jgi:hypothetical protein
VNRILALTTGLILAWPGTAFGQSPRKTSSKPKRHSGGYQINLYLVNSQVVPAAVLAKAESMAARIFANIGISVAWKIGKAREPQSDAEMIIEIQLDSGEPLEFHAGALAYAMPYGITGTRIHVFCDRVISIESPALSGPYLGHVIAHEITHVLEGISRHSPHGVMKAQWDLGDFYQMVFQPMQFDADDVELIRIGIERRAQSSQTSERGEPLGDEVIVYVQLTT